MPNLAADYDNRSLAFRALSEVLILPYNKASTNNLG